MVQGSGSLLARPRSSSKALVSQASTESPAIAGSDAERHGLTHTIPGTMHPGSRTTHHGPEARAPISMAGLGRRRVGRHSLARSMLGPDPRPCSSQRLLTPDLSIYAFPGAGHRAVAPYSGLGQCPEQSGCRRLAASNCQKSGSPRIAAWHSGARIAAW